MRAISAFVALFFIIPLVEIWLFIKVGQVIGAGWTIILIVLTTLLGAALLRLQGFSTLTRIQRLVAQGEMPAIDVLAGFLLFIAGALLLTPGFFTDILGFTLLIPAVRQALAMYWFDHHTVKIKVAKPDSPPTRVIEVKEFYHD